jgi:A/G-specific adenine glycosylase
VCPLIEICLAAREGRQAELPGVKQRRARPAREAVLLIAVTGADGASSVLVERRPAAGIWGGLWSPPQFATEAEALAWCRRELGAVENPESLAPIEHGFTHFDLRLQPLRVRCTPSSAVREADDRIWYPLSSPPKVGLPQPIHQLFERMLNARAVA